MLDNIYILYKLVTFVFFKGFVIRNYYEFYEFYSINFNIINCTSQYKECNHQYEKKHYIYCQHKDSNRAIARDSIYIVKPGDTLCYIAWVTGNNYLDLAKNNNIKNINLLKVNQILRVKRNVIKLLLYKNLPRKILLSWYRNHFKMKKLFFLNKKNTVALKTNKNLFYKLNIIDNTSFDLKNIGIKSVCCWHWPTNGLIIDTFSEAEGGNKGIDISGVFDQPVLATTNGRVVYVGNVLKGYGNLVVIKHANNYLSAYAHNNKVLVTERQQVKIGDQIATMGNSGTNEVKLHFEIRYKGKSVNPLNLLP